MADEIAARPGQSPPIKSPANRPIAIRGFVPRRAGYRRSSHPRGGGRGPWGTMGNAGKSGQDVGRLLKESRDIWADILGRAGDILVSVLDILAALEGFWTGSPGLPGRGRPTSCGGPRTSCRERPTSWDRLAHINSRAGHPRARKIRGRIIGPRVAAHSARCRREPTPASQNFSVDSTTSTCSIWPRRAGCHRGGNGGATYV